VCLMAGTEPREKRLMNNIEGRMHPGIARVWSAWGRGRLQENSWTPDLIMQRARTWLTANRWGERSPASNKGRALPFAAWTDAEYAERPRAVLVAMPLRFLRLLLERVAPVTTAADMQSGSLDDGDDDRDDDDEASPRRARSHEVFERVEDRTFATIVGCSNGTTTTTAQRYLREFGQFQKSSQ